MPTPPLSQAILAMLSSRRQAMRWHAELHEVREFRAFCCNLDASTILGIAKNPVIILDVSPNPVCLGASISWDMTGSYAPSSTITSWEIDFGDGSGSDSGADIATASGNYTYAAAGVYTIEATVAEGGGLNQTVHFQVEVVECGIPAAVSGTYGYFATDGAGVYYIDWTAASPAAETRNTGLTGLALYVRNIVQQSGTKHLLAANHILWIATGAGVYKSTNGGNSWQQMLGDLDVKKVVLDPTDRNTVYAVVEDSSLYVYKSTDSGLTWINREVTA